MRDERTNPRVPTHPQRTHKRCPACGQVKPLAAFYLTQSGGPSGYCKACQRSMSRLSARRRAAAVRLLAAAHPAEWAAARALVRGHRPPSTGGGGRP
jgi:uncharacterized protein (DUF983 family)